MVMGYRFRLQIKSLEAEKRAKDAVLKRKQEEIAALRRVGRAQRGSQLKQKGGTYLLRSVAVYLQRCERCRDLCSCGTFRAIYVQCTGGISCFIFRVIVHDCFHTM